MKAEEIKVDLEELKRFKKKNAEERMKFIDYWVDYIKSHSDKEWSRQQNIVINSQIDWRRKGNWPESLSNPNNLLIFL